MIRSTIICGHNRLQSLKLFLIIIDGDFSSFAMPFFVQSSRPFLLLQELVHFMSWNHSSIILRYYLHLNVKVSVYSLISPLSSADFTIYTPWYWNSLLHSLISSGENSAFAHFAAAIANHYNLPSSFHQVSSLLGRQRRMI